MCKLPQIKEFIYHCDVDSNPKSIDKFIFKKSSKHPFKSPKP